jgi:hypothetical protein
MTGASIRTGPTWMGFNRLMRGTPIQVGAFADKASTPTAPPQ